MESANFYTQETMPHLHKEVNFSLPTQVGPYRIHCFLYRGTMSHLYLGTHPDSRDPIVIKVLSPALISHQEMIEQFLKEAKIISLTDHKNIIRVYDQGKWEQGVYIALEFIQGISLRQFIQGQSLSLKRIVDLLLQISHALLHLHTHGVIHRDLKPENILINQHGEVKVIDFGIAQLIDQPTTLSSNLLKGWVGTPNYMSPEQKNDPHHIDVKADIYAIGVIAYELLLGRLSFGKIDLSLLPKNLQPIIGRALEPNPQKRTSDIVDFISDLTTYLNNKAYQEDRSQEDELREMIDSLSQEHHALLPSSPPTWSEIEFGIAKSSGVELFGLYYDYFRLPDGSMVIAIIESSEGSIASMTSLTTFRAIFRTKMNEYTHPSKGENPFVTSRFVAELNRLLCQEPHRVEESLCLIHLSPFLNEFAFICSGLEALWHLPYQGQHPRKLENHSPLLGRAENAEFFATIDTWNPGDLIICHTLTHPKKDIVDRICEEGLRQYRHSSLSTLSESLLRNLEQQLPSQKARLLLSLSRL